MSLFVFDVDGTLVEDATNHHAPELLQHLEALRSKGHWIAVITGRFGLPRSFLDLIRPHARALGNGQRIVLGETQVAAHPLTPEEVQQVMRLIPAGMDVHGSALSDRPLTFVADLEDPQWSAFRARGQLLHLNQMPDHDILQLQFRGAQVPLLKARIREQLPHLNTSGGLEPYLDTLVVTAKQANKGHALREIARLLSVPLEEVIAFGDSENDIEMLRIAGHSVQVGDFPALQGICKEQVSCPLIGLPGWLAKHLEGL